MSMLGTALLAQIEAATGAGDFGAVKQTLARCATGIVEGEFEPSETELILRAARVANKSMHDARRRAGVIVKASKAAEAKRCADQTRVTLALDQVKRLDDGTGPRSCSGQAIRKMVACGKEDEHPALLGVFSWRQTDAVVQLATFRRKMRARFRSAL